MSSKKILARTTVLVIALGTCLLHAGQANASPPAGAIHAAMTVTSFNQTVATQNGYKWVTPPDVGDAYVVKQADYTTCNNQQGTTATRNSCYSAHKGVSPADTIGGNCGDSYFYMSGSSGTSNRAYYYVSGFDNLPHEAISYNWEVDVNGPNSYSHSDRFDGGLDFRSSWETGTVSVPVSTSGYYYGSVYGLNSIAVLFTGGVCFSTVLKPIATFTKVDNAIGPNEPTQ